MVDRSIASTVLRRKLTYLGPEKLDSLYKCIDSVQESEIPGDFAEFGVALGGSGICLAHALNGGRRYLGFDVFGTIPPPSDIDGTAIHDRYKIIASGRSSGIDGDRYYGYINNLIDVVKANFSSFGCNVDDKRILLIKGIFTSTLPLYNDISIAIAHVDCDWYEPVLYCLNFVWPRLSLGGFIVVDDYNDWNGCKKATDEFLSSHKNAQLVRHRPHAVIRKPASLTSLQTDGIGALHKWLRRYFWWLKRSDRVGLSIDKT
jgi:O-methyltransferase